MAPDASSGGVAAARPAAAAGRAYVTFLAGDGDYVKGVVGLVKGLRKVGAAYPVVAAVWPDVPEEHRRLLVAQGCVVREIEPLYPSQDESPFARDYYVVNYSKLQFWQFVEYSKMIYLDADMQVFQNIDHLFDLPNGYLYAVADCVCEEHGPPCPETLPWPETLLGPRPSFYFNGGMFVFQPNLCTYKSLLKCFQVTPPTAFAEQDFLNMFFKDKCKRLPYVYNMLVNMLWRHPDKVELSKAKVVHYCVDGAKPWRYTGKEDQMSRDEIKALVNMWRDIYNEPSLDYNDHSLKKVSYNNAGVYAATYGLDGDETRELVTTANVAVTTDLFDLGMNLIGVQCVVNGPSAA
ncbi:unnamed protein product [Cuscuta campestris]|uniref:Hexosyltransferase n=1 Tax=Cuscuta campestris TaxID=132261 RepID=A0A484MAG7_9ASTE|nr:unnamed protein product [Cuscuta campestris]